MADDSENKPGMTDAEYSQLLVKALCANDKELISAMTGGHTRDSFNALIFGDDEDAESVPSSRRPRRRRKSS